MEDKKLRICCVSHSNCALRQQKFWKEMSNIAEVLVIAPSVWNQHNCESVKDGNYELYAVKPYLAGNMIGYHFPPEAYMKVFEWKPDVIYYQGEVYTNMAIISQQWAKLIGAKYVQFCWENIRYPTGNEQKFLSRCDLIICGNQKAKELHGGNVVLPQVGIETSEFRYSDEKKYPILFMGRNDPQKGTEYIKEAYPDTYFIHDAPYDKVPEILSQTKILVSYPYDSERWCEQWASYINIEALASGCIVITSDSEAIREYLLESPAIIVPMKNSELLKSAINNVLNMSDDQLKNKSNQGISFVKRFDNKSISGRLLKIFEVLFL